MAISTIDPTSALIVVDLQRGIVRMPTVHPSDEIVANAVRLVGAFRERGRPIVFVHVGWSADSGDVLTRRVERPSPSRGFPADFSTFVDDLGVDPERDVTVLKHQWNAFYGTDLDLQLRRRGVGGVVLCGISTSIGVESTARAAWERNYELTFASNAMTDTVAAAHDRALEIIFPRLGEVGTTDEVIAAL